MNNLLSYCGLVDVRIKGSDKDLPVHHIESPELKGHEDSLYRVKWPHKSCGKTDILQTEFLQIAEITY